MCLTKDTALDCQCPVKSSQQCLFKKIISVANMQIREIWLKEDIVELFEAVYEENLETVETKYVRTVFTWALGWGWGGGGG